MEAAGRGGRSPSDRALGDSIVSLREVGKAYRRGRQEVAVLHGLELDIARGDFIALMGPSGSGKSTLLNLIGGLDRPTRGTVTVDDQRIDQMKGAQLARWRADNVGFIFQFYNLMPVLSALRNVELPLLLQKMSGKERRRRAQTALEIVALSERAKHRPAELSGGQQQRVAIARALVTDPKLLICDEPTGDLDRATADEILALLRTLNEEFGKTIIMVTHDHKAAEQARHTLTLDKGQLLAESSA
ncbi:MAG: ABC transporter ATP-binding protein [Pseudomonadota bacterium]